MMVKGKSLCAPREQLRQAKLYCITLPASLEGSLEKMVEKACWGGADVIQLRDKKMPVQELIHTSRRLKEICSCFQTLFIVNDHLDAALAGGADGVHLGQEDLSIPDARRAIKEFFHSNHSGDGSEFLIGCSTHCLDQALRAEKQGADYVGCGPIFSTPTKPGVQAVGLDLVKQYREHLRIPFVAIGGIDSTNLEQLIRSGASCAAVVRAAFEAGDIQGAVRSLKAKFKK